MIFRILGHFPTCRDSNGASIVTQEPKQSPRQLSTLPMEHQSTCPNCNNTLNVHRQPGDIKVCIWCQAILAINPDYSLRIATDDDISQEARATLLALIDVGHEALKKPFKTFLPKS